MASLRRFSNSKFWYVCYRDGDGTQRQISTKLIKRQEADVFRLEIERVYQPDKRALVAAQARKIISELVERTCGSALDAYTIRAWIEEWLGNVKNKTSPNTYARYEGIARNFLAHLGSGADEDLGTIQPRDIQKFIDQEVKQGKTSETANMGLRCLSIPFNNAKRLGYLPTNPCEAIRPLKTRPKEKGVFTPDEVRRLVAQATDEWKGVILLGFYTGARLSDITHLKVSQLHFDRGLITFDQAKTGKIVQVPMHPVVAELLKPAQTLPKEAQLFPGLSTKSVAGKSGLSQTFRRLLDKAGIEIEALRKAKGKGRTVGDRSFHSLRHTFNSILANKGVPEELRGRLTGHAQFGQNQIYTHIDHDQLTKVIQKLPSLQQPKEKE